MTDTTENIQKEIYTDYVYFIGNISNEGCKTGSWEGFYRNKKIASIGYLNCARPLNTLIWNKKGKQIANIGYSIID